MGLIAAKCTQCGANIKVDDTKDAGICEFCGTAFVIEKAINNYKISADKVIVNSDNINISNYDIESALEAINKLLNSELYDDAKKLIVQIIEKYPYDYRGWWQMALLQYNQDGYWFDDNKNYQKALALADDSEIIKKYRDKEYEKLWKKVINSDSSHNSSNKKGCYIATCIYGSYDCPEVWTLRRFRDHKLDKTWYGKIFIKIYYAVSPNLVKWFGETEIFRNVFGKILNKVVLYLNNKGIDNTLYKDK